jgi:hypothetical protein
LLPELFLPELPKYRRCADMSAICVLNISRLTVASVLAALDIQRSWLLDGGVLYKIKLSPRSDQISAFSLLLTLFNFAQYLVQHEGSTQHWRFLIDNAPGPDR